MRLQTALDIRLSDFTNGVFERETGGGTVAANVLCSEILEFFKEPGSWSDFPKSEDPKALTIRKALLNAELLYHDSAPNPADAELFVPTQTMFDAPFRKPEDVSRGEIVFVGAPIDIGTTNFPGARFGPQTLRQASLQRFQFQLNIETWGMEPVFLPALNGPVFDGARMSDLGDLKYRPGEPPESYYKRLRDIVNILYARGAFPVVLGGDHSITYATVPPEKTDLVQFDAHTDLAALVPGDCHHHGNFLSRLLDEGRVGEVFQYGLRDTSGRDTTAAGTHARGVFNLEQPDWAEELQGRSVFVTLDLDVLDPTQLPGTGTRSIGGITLRCLCESLARVIQVARPVGLDIVELCPMRDSTGISEQTANEALIIFLALYHAKYG